MRPLRLQLEAFTAFRRRQELVLGPHDLFAISGPTGAGKSSLLDALVFALYGKVPRGLAPRELIALGRSEGWVLLEFAVDSRKFRVTRKVVRGAKGGVQTQAQLEELENGRESSLADGVTAVNAEVQRLVGLNFETFTQAVILPQGEFARFLQAEPRVRNAILRDLLRLSVYERMRQRAHESARTLKQELEQRERVLGDEYASATPETVAAERGAAQRAQAAAEAAGAEVERVEAQLLGQAGLRARAALTAERCVRRARASELEQAASRWAADEARLDAARRAGAVLPRLEQLEVASQRAGRLARDADAAQARLDTAVQTLAEAQARAERAEHDAAELPQLETRLAALGQALALQAPLLAARKREGDAQAEARQREENARLLEARARQAAASLDEARATAERARRVHETSGYESAEHERLEAAREQLAAVEPRRAALAAAAADGGVAAQSLARLEAQHSDARARVDVATRDLETAAHERERAEQALRSAEREHEAAHLRAGLRVGQACPVCERKLARLPAAATAPLLDVLREPAEQARAHDERARAALASAREAAARAEAAAGQARDAQLERDLQVERLRGELAPLEARLREALGATAEASLRESLARLAAAREAREAARAGAERAQAEVERAVLRADQARSEAEAGERELKTAGERLAEAVQARHALQAQLTELGTSDDPLAEERGLVGRRTTLRESSSNAARTLAAAREQEAAAKAAAASAGEAGLRAHAEAAAAKAAADLALAEGGFREASAARAAALDEAAQQALRRSLAADRAETTAVAQRILELEASLAKSGGPISPEDLAGHELRLAAARESASLALREAATRGSQLQELERRAAQAERFALELKGLSARQQTYKSLADDLRSDQFQAWLLEETFRDLMVGASQRLQELSGRYTFEYANDEFHVLDHDHAGERRRADSLSGGETFLASLALALELSQQVQRAAGAVHLDSLFIDEGFGTLDPETLDTIAGAIENLGVAGRMVGIVTHVPELTARLPVRFMVKKRPEGSDVVVEGA